MLLRCESLEPRMSQNGVVRPCSSPASEPKLAKGTEDKGVRHVRETAESGRGLLGEIA
jgi:hypothetical protein